MKSLASARRVPVKMQRATRNALSTIAACFLLGGLLASTGCGGTTQSSALQTPAPDAARIDWGMSLLAGGTVGVGQFPAKFNFDINAAPDCVNDFIVYNTSLHGSPEETANIVAFNHLYATQGSVGGLCAQDGPSVYWSYYTGGGSVTSSVVLSLDGSKVAFVEDNGDGAILRILKWVPGEGTGAGSPDPVDQDISGSAWSACTGGNSCVASVAFGNSGDDAISAPFVDYVNDALYVGDSSGVLHKFSGVFNGTPQEVTTSGWPITVNAGFTLSSAVYDSASGNIFVGDSSGLLSYVQDTNSTVGSCLSEGSAPCLGSTSQSVGSAGSIVDGPIVDGTNQTVFAVNGTDTTSNGTILEASTDLTTAESFSIGGDGAGAALYGGAFDQTYIDSSPGSTAGFMYVCGKNPTFLSRPAIYQLTFASNGFISGVGTPLLLASTTSGAACSPVTEINNTGSSAASGEWIFFSIGNFAANASPIPTTSHCRSGVDATNGHKGCVVGINLTNAANPSINPGGTWPPAAAFFTTPGGNNNSNATPLPLSNAGSSSGIVVDNVGTGSNTSNIYFSLGVNSVGAGPGVPSCNTTAGVGCAVKLTQAALN